MVVKDTYKDTFSVIIIFFLVIIICNNYVSVGFKLITTSAIKRS